MGFVRMIDVDRAEGRLDADYRRVAESYSHGLGFELPTPELYKVSSLVPAYSHAMAESQRCLTGDGQHYCESDALIPRLFTGFCVATLSACFH